MNPRTLKMAAAVAFAFASVAPTFAADSASIQLPPELAKLKPSTHPGYLLATQKCGVCHSIDYIDQQPPALTTAQWTAEVTKMKRAYGAPLDDVDIREIGAYLAVAYGTPTAMPVAVPASAPSAPAGPVDVTKLMADNGCLACHAADRKVFGPAYHDVALKYRADATAVDKLAASIRAGSTGKWGSDGMPPFASLSEGDAKALAGYVMKQ